MNLILLSIVIFSIALAMTMIGRGGGNFYVIVLVFSGISMHESALTGQFVLFISSISATLIFAKRRQVEWKLVLLLGVLTAVPAYFGGLFAYYFSGKLLKFTFSFFLFVAAFLMFRPVKEKRAEVKEKFGLLKVRSGIHEYKIDVRIAVPVIMATGFGAGLVGASGGAFLVPLLVISCGVPMNLAIGTSITIVAGTALMGFAGHMATGNFVPGIVIPLAIAAAIGGILGSSFAMKTKPRILKELFAFTTLLASVIMIINAILSR